MSNDQTAPAQVREHLSKLNRFVDPIQPADGEWAIGTGGDGLVKLSDVLALSALFSQPTHYSVSDTLSELYYIFTEAKILDVRCDVVKDFKVSLEGLKLRIDVEVGGYDSGRYGKTADKISFHDVAYTYSTTMTGLAERMFVITSLNSIHPSMKLNTNHLTRDFTVERMGDLLSIYEGDSIHKYSAVVIAALQKNRDDYLEVKRRLCEEVVPGTDVTTALGLIERLKQLVSERNELMATASA